MIGRNPIWLVVSRGPFWAQLWSSQDVCAAETDTAQQDKFYMYVDVNQESVVKLWYDVHLTIQRSASALFLLQCTQISSWGATRTALHRAALISQRGRWNERWEGLWYTCAVSAPSVSQASGTSVPTAHLAQKQRKRTMVVQPWNNDNCATVCITLLRIT